MTETTLRFLGISGSLRAGSYNTLALHAAAALAPPGVVLEIADISAIPFFSQDIEAAGLPAPVAALQAQVAAADALIFATPEYNSGLPGVLKNALDWLSRPPSRAAGKPAAVLGCSPGNGGTGRAQTDFRNVAAGMGILLLPGPQIMIGSAHTRFDADGKLTDETTGKFLASLLAALRDWTIRLGAPA